MLDDLIDEMYQLEETYWWHVAKRRLVIALLKSYLESSSGKLSFLDLGCGTGMMLNDLSRYGKVVGVDVSTRSLSYCLKRGFPSVLVANLAKSFPSQENQFDVVTMLDVLEHLENDDFVLGEVFRSIKSGGYFVLTVPAYQSLWTYWDEALGHKRRYRKGELAEKLTKAGFIVSRSSYFYSYLLPGVVVFRIIKSLLGESYKKRSDFVKVPMFLNKILLTLSYFETDLVKRVSIPSGLSIIFVCKKR